MNSTGFGVIAWLSAGLTLVTIVMLLGSPVIGFMLMFLLGVFHIIIALVMLFRAKRLKETLRKLFYAYCIGVLAYFGIGVLMIFIFGDSGDEGIVAAGLFAMVLAISFSALKFVIHNTDAEKKFQITDENILDA